MKWLLIGGGIVAAWYVLTRTSAVPAVIVASPRVPVNRAGMRAWTRSTRRRF